MRQTFLTKKKPYYIFDQSSLSKMDYYPIQYREFKPFWRFFDKLIEKDQFGIPKEVYLEAQLGPKSIREWLHTKKNQIMWDIPEIY